MLALVADHASEIAELCRRFHVRRLEVFGSAADGEGFDPNSSDVDFLVEFDTGETLPSLETFFALREGLAEVLERPVDLAMMGAIRNPYIRNAIERTRQSIYAS
jgi:predicted nucleotidyltransferase